MDTIKNLVIFTFWCIIIVGIGIGIWLKGCWDDTSHSAEHTIQEFYRDGGMHDQIVQQEEQERQTQQRLQEQYRQQDNHSNTENHGAHIRHHHQQDDENQDN